MKRSGVFITLAVCTLALIVADLSVGSVAIPLRDVWGALTGGECSDINRTIILDIRLVKTLVALLAGWALAVSGLQMQTVFRNPLAGPYVLGVSSGASLAVAVLLLAAPAAGVTASGALGLAGAAWVGSGLVLAVIAAVALRVRDIMAVLIIGIMVSASAGAIVQILQYLSNDESLKSFVVWTMGSLGNVTDSQLPLLGGAVLAGLLLAVLTLKPLNLLLLGEDYARTMGVSLRRSRLLVFTSTTLLAGTVTAFCGPIGFVGMAMPHLGRLMVHTSDHRILMPATALTGGIVMLVCDIVSKWLVLPVNALTALVGIPIIIWVIIRHYD